MQENPCRVASKLIEHGRSTHLLCVESLKRGVLFPGLKKQGYDIRQVLDFPGASKNDWCIFGNAMFRHSH